ncbi:N-carbamoyl-L-amino acid hydrolase [Botrimarina colliarenosi]|uniref:N-carbamoyl-L-amino acid hydrolase n=1 Tax=Botrimarina colliarenosi TaxID=2528001 RepID=A0A5C6AEQ5_9BACT|nr:M20 family metallo-hydrolase [Botrimarina colliarenosi]TWT97897.1 N-carbamoyl-L-amino acid hydrolase [Botrimarina colliarenosi]
MINDAPQVDVERLVGELQALAAISDCPEPPPAVTRVVFTETDLRARDYLRSLYEAAGLTVRVDPIGNTFARWHGSDPKASAVGTGSHCDAIPHAGMYDGTVGVLSGLEAIRALQASGYQPRRSIEVVMFTSEEPTRFGVGCTGSRLMSGAMSPADLAKLTDEADDDYDTVRRRAGFTGELSEVRLPGDYYDAFVELHIEQGPELEAGDLAIGAVTAIAAPAQANFTVTGEGGHAGAVLMPRRRDALVAAAEMIAAIDSIARASRSPDLVATVGKLEVHPGAVNSIPSKVTFSLDLRDIDGANRDAVLKQIEVETEQIATRREVQLEHRTLNADPPATSDPRIVDAVVQSATSLGQAHQKMISRAYHDSLFMARVAPMGMIFIPCRGGVSHRPDEYSSPEALAAGVQTLALTLAELAR